MKLAGSTTVATHFFKRVLDSDGQPSAWTIPSLPFDDFVQGQYPYSYYDAKRDGSSISLRSTDFSVRDSFNFSLAFLRATYLSFLVVLPTAKYYLYKILSSAMSLSH